MKKKQHIHEMSMATMRILRWMLGNTRNDIVMNAYISKKIQVAPIEKKLMKGHLR
jgi:hypothetical protein